MMIPVGVLQGVALDRMLPAEPVDIASELLPLHGEPNSSPTVGEAALALASGGTVLQSLRSSEGGAAWDNRKPGILVEASGATVGALLVKGLVLTIPEGPRRMWQGDTAGLAKLSSRRLAEALGLGQAFFGLPPVHGLAGTLGPKSKHKSLIVTTFFLGAVRFSLNEPAAALALASAEAFLRLFDRRVCL